MTEEDRRKLSIFGKRALSTLFTVYNSFELAEHCILDNIGGDFVECGVFAGTQVAAMAYACQKYNYTKKIHLFDSFEGIPQAGIYDDKTITDCIGIGAGELKTTNVSSCSLDQVRHHMVEWAINLELLEFHKGWFQDTVPQIIKDINTIAILRLDGDLYESTKICLEYLHPLVVSGGYVIIDDYALTGCRKAVEEYHSKVGLNPKIISIEGGLGPVYYKV